MRYIIKFPRSIPIHFLLQIRYIYLLFIFLGISHKVAAQGPPPQIASGLEITRSQIIKVVKEIDTSFIFKQEKEINNSPSYLAVNTHYTSVELIGEEKELKSVRWLFTLNNDITANKQAILNMCYFMYFIGREKGKVWLNERLIAMSKNLKTEYTSEEKVLDFNRKAQFIYSAKQKMMSLTFIEW